MTTTGAVVATAFANRSARQKKELGWQDVVDRISEPPERDDKSLLPWIKLGTFGDLRTAAGCLRSKRNLIDIRGVECDYDEGIVTFEEACDRVIAADIEALLYTTPSHREGCARWRVLALCSKPYPPHARNVLCAYMNGIVGQGNSILSAESFHPAQAYYYGKLYQQQYKFWHTRGDYIDQVLDTLPYGPVWPNEVEIPREFNPPPRVQPTPDDWINTIQVGEHGVHDSLVSLAMHLVTAAHADQDSATKLLRDMMSGVVWREHHRERWEERYHEIPRIVEGAIRLRTQERARRGLSHADY